MTITTHPGELHTLYNPCIIRVTKGDEEKAAIKVVFGSSAVNLEREYFNFGSGDEAYFDIQNILKKGIESGIVPISGSPCWIDKQFFVHYSVFDNLNVKIYEATGINAVAQIQEIPNLTDQRGHFMTKFDKLRWYSGFPLEIVAFAFRTGDTYIRFDGDDFTEVDADVFVIPITSVHSSIEIGNQNYDKYIRDNQGRIITTNQLEPLEINTDDDYKQFMMPIENPCTPDNPFYVRWENQQGGFDYWMFGVKQTITKSLTGSETFMPVVLDVENAKTFEQIISLEATEKIKVGSQNISQNDFDCLSKIIYSKKIEWYANSKWQQIFVDSGDSENDTKAILKDIELTFRLQNPKLQI